MASGRCEGNVQPWRAPLELTKWSKDKAQEDVCVCVCVHMCRDLHFSFMYATNYTHTPSSLQFGYLLSRVHNGLYTQFLTIGCSSST
jgi:hypothetical protein